MPVWIPGVDIPRTTFLRTSFKMLKRVVYKHMKQECFVVGLLKLFSSKVLCANHFVFVQKNIISNKQERISKHESSSKSIKVVANIHVGLQFSARLL